MVCRYSLINYVLFGENTKAKEINSVGMFKQWHGTLAQKTLQQAEMGKCDS